jgi:hypothetical protein
LRTDGSWNQEIFLAVAGALRMHEYRAYIIGPDGHIQSRVDLLCKNENTAIAQAKQLVDGHDVELWQYNRQIAKFKHTK